MNFAGSVRVLHQSSGTAAELENIMLILLQLGLRRFMFHLQIYIYIYMYIWLGSTGSHPL
ncbi:hypothetical protein M6B38_271235 [Iris pallida]|uniref:Uncharacterized protein n=1 Tax=Iris pallida TaxID=29817 RepID=A0AAX6I7R8_IRIPA|nr:hypothetical protein M6B38_271235 [Iris pallida]